MGSASSGNAAGSDLSVSPVESATGQAPLPRGAGLEVEGQRAAAARDAVQDGSPLGGIKLRFSAHRSFSFSYRYRRLRWRGIFPARIEQDSVDVIPSPLGVAIVNSGICAGSRPLAAQVPAHFDQRTDQPSAFCRTGLHPSTRHTKAVALLRRLPPLISTDFATSGLRASIGAGW